MIIGDNLVRGIPVSDATLFYGNGLFSYKADGAIAGIQIEVIGDYSISGNFLPEGWEMSNNENLIILYSLDGSHLEDDKLFEYTGDLTVVSAIVADWFESAINVNSIIIPKEYSLSAAYPNPFNPVTNMSLDMRQIDYTL
jgi:hypothetical protein